MSPALLNTVRFSHSRLRFEGVPVFPMAPALAFIAGQSEMGVINVGGQFLFQLIPSSIVQISLATLLSAILYPFFGIVETLLYYDARIRRQGFDIEYLSSPGVAGAAPS